MSSTTTLLIAGLGASTPIGRNVPASAAAARAGVCGFSEHPYMVDTAGQPMRVACASWLDAEIDPDARPGELLLPAIDEALEPLAGIGSPARLGLALALPPPRPGTSPGLAGNLREMVADRYPGLFFKVLAFEAGHAAGHLALNAASLACSAGSIDACVVAGVDSYLAPDTLDWLEECDQLHGGGPLNNAWGFIPGEAAGAVLVASPAFAGYHGLEALGEIVGVGIGREAHLIKTDAVCIGEGLTQAFRQALQALDAGEQIHNVFCDLNGEPYRADEYGFAALRTSERFRSATDFVAPADCWGDVGAAGALLHIALAVLSHRKCYGHGPLSLVWASSESGERGAAVIRGLDPREA
jgi:3-oxoacyl-[acyl-carrier-protein] synthase-1